jgi:adhesin HecA-like repeat protein
MEPAEFGPAHPGWALVTDQVMGGVSRGRLTRETVAGRAALRLRGDVSLDNNGGFIQIALDLAGGGLFDARGFKGVALEVCGPAQTYGLHLRTADLTRPWQSFRQGFAKTPDWHIVHLPFAGFEAHRTDASLDLARLRRLGLVAIGREFTADLSLAALSFYR